MATIQNQRLQHKRIKSFDGSWPWVPSPTAQTGKGELP
jgi:hypothetical protein